METLQHPPAGLFKGCNFMTPEIVGYRRIVHESRVYFVELSKETPPYFPGRTSPLYGVTVRNYNGEDPDDLSQAVESLEDAELYLKELENAG